MKLKERAKSTKNNTAKARQGESLKRFIFCEGNTVNEPYEQSSKADGKSSEEQRFWLRLSADKIADDDSRNA